MPKLHKKVKKNEERCKKLHQDMNMKVGPTRKEPLTLFVLPDLDPLQKQLNRIENAVNHEARIRRRSAWKSRNQRS